MWWSVQACSLWKVLALALSMAVLLLEALAAFYSFLPHQGKVEPLNMTAIKEKGISSSFGKVTDVKEISFIYKVQRRANSCVDRKKRYEMLQKCLKAYISLDGNNLAPLEQFLKQNPPDTALNCSKPTLYLESYGRLGNILFEFASHYALSLLYDYKLKLSNYAAKQLEKCFGIVPGDIFTVGDAPLGVKVIDHHRSHNSRTLDKELLQFPFDTDIKVGSYFQSFKYFSFIDEKIRLLYTFKEEHKNNANAVLLDIYNSISHPVTFVGVHVRRRDMLTFWINPTKNFFLKAMDYMKEILSSRKLHFVVASDDIEWCKQTFQDQRDMSFLGQSPAQDMATLSSCNHTIMSVGSFSWWSAYLTNGKVVYYKDYSNNDLLERVLKKHDIYHSSDFFPPSWHGIGT